MGYFLVRHINIPAKQLRNRERQSFCVTLFKAKISSKTAEHCLEWGIGFFQRVSNFCWLQRGGGPMGPGYPDEKECDVLGRPLSTEARGSYLVVGVASPGTGGAVVPGW